MTDRRAPSPLDYATPPTFDVRRDQVIAHLVFVGASAAALYLGVELAFTIIYFYASPSLFHADVWTILALAKLAAGPMLIGCAALALRGPSRTRQFIKACTITATFITVLDLALNARILSPNSPAGAAATVNVFMDHLAANAAQVFLFMPLLLMRHEGSGNRWRTRALGLAAMTTFLSGLNGVPVLLRKSWFVQQLTGGTAADALQAALRKPAPIIGLWPMAGLAAAALLVVAIFKPRAPLVGFAVLLAVVFRITFCTTQTELVTSGQPYLALLYATYMGRDVLCTLVPIALIAWAMWRERGAFAPASM